MTVIKVENLTKEYILGKTNFSSFIRENIIKKDIKTKIALNNINLEIKKNDRVALIGKNGSGKSTLLKILSRVTYPSKGKVLVSGKVSSILEAGAGFHPELTGRENIFLVGAILGMDSQKILSKCEDIIEFSEIEDQIDTPIKKYSSGMAIKLAFAICAYLDGDIFLFDEILAVADEKFRKKATDRIMHKVKHGNKTLILVSHNERNIFDICDKAILINEGSILNVGKIEKIFDEYNKIIYK